jgi:hypothetical protein
MTDFNRRSFLALLAGAFAVKPSTFLPSYRETVWTRFSVWENVTVVPKEQAQFSLFRAPFPGRFQMEALRWIVDPMSLACDVREVAEKLKVTVRCLEHLWLESGLSLLPCSSPILFVGEQKVVPVRLNPNSGDGKIMPRPIRPEGFDFDLSAPALTLERPVKLQMVMDGIVSVKR